MQGTPRAPLDPPPLLPTSRCHQREGGRGVQTEPWCRSRHPPPPRPAAAKKKNKKGKTLTLTDFLAEDGGSGAPTYIPKPVSWADETDDLDGDGRGESEPRVTAICFGGLLSMLRGRSLHGLATISVGWPLSAWVGHRV